MKRISFLVIIIICLICVANHCKREDCHKRIIFINNSQKEIYVSGGGTMYPDTLNFHMWFSNPIRHPDFYRVKSGEIMYNAVGPRNRDCLEKAVGQGRIFIYVFDAEILATVPWDSIGKNYMVLKTYHPSIEEMERSNWTIIYTGE